MRKALLSSICLLFACALFAQVEVETNSLASETTPFLCSPGVRHKTPGKGASIDYTFNPDFRMKSPDLENTRKVRSNERFGANFKVPLVHRPNLKVMLGFKYAFEKHNIRDIDPANYPLFQRLNDVKLKRTEAAAYLVMPINRQLYTSVRLSAGYQGDYSGLVSTDKRYGVYRAAGVLGVKKNEELEYGIGLLFSRNVRNTNIVPFGFINYTINDHWGIESAIPSSVKLRYNFNERNIGLFGVEYSSQNYSVRVMEPQSVTAPVEFGANHYHYRRASLLLSGTLYRQTSDWTWLQLKLGYAFDLNSEARDMTEMRTYDLRTTGSILGTVSFFLSPPKRYLR